MKIKYPILVVQSKKRDYNTKITEIEMKLTDHIHDKYITTPELNTWATNVFNARLARANLVTKTDFDAKRSSLNRKIAANKSKHLLVGNELKKLKTFDSRNFRGKSHFKEDNTQNYLVFQPMYRYFKRVKKRILKVLVLVFIFIFGNLKGCLMKISQLLLRVIINLTRN